MSPLPSPNVAVRRFTAVLTLSLLAKLAGLALFLVIVLKLWGGF